MLTVWKAGFPAAYRAVHISRLCTRVHDMLRPTAVLDQRVSTGLDALDTVLGGLYWGDNVVWQLDGARSRRSTGRSRPGEFESATMVSLGRAVNTYGIPGLTVLEGRAPGDLLREIARPAARHRLLLFGPLDAMVRAWGAAHTREFFARCCPLLLESARSPTGR